MTTALTVTAQRTTVGMTTAQKATAQKATAQKATARPTSLITTCYGAFVRRLGGWLAVAHLITALAELGFDDTAVRAAISRLKRRGWLEQERRGGAVGYALSAVATAVLDRGDERIYGTQKPAALADGWVLAVFSVPERERHRRHQLRSRLSWLGFGNTAPGVWIAPRRLLPAARETIAALELTDYVDLFAGDHAGFGDPATVAARAWDLDGLRARYVRFIDGHGAIASGADDRAAFVAYLPALDEWRRLPFLDPGLPIEVLPTGWEGGAAAEVFATLRASLEGSAYEHLRGIVAG